MISTSQLVAGPTLRLRIWLLPSLAMLLSLGATALWWQRQLPAQLSRSAGNGEWIECLQASRQLQALGWLEPDAAAQQSLCRRRQAAALWDSGAQRAALHLQQQLVRSANASPDDTTQLQAWRQALQERALNLYQQGELGEALQRLAHLNQGKKNSGLSTALTDNWHRNRLNAQRARELVRQQRWWEALDRLNRIDHPWWHQQTLPQRQQLNAALATLEASQEHLQHGSHHDNVLEGEALNQAVEQKLQQGLEPWMAFEAGCRSLGGTVEEDGPESFCRAGSNDQP